MSKKQYHGVTVNDLYNGIYKSFNELADTILSYESDTFSSEENELTAEEAEKIAMSFIIKDIEQRYWAYTMDGGMISDELTDIRSNT